MQTLVVVYLTRNNLETLDTIIKNIEAKGIEVFTTSSRRDTLVMVKSHDKKNADVVVDAILFNF